MLWEERTDRYGKEGKKAGDRFYQGLYSGTSDTVSYSISAGKYSEQHI